MIELFVLALLTECDMYGYRFKKEIVSRTGGVYDYPVTMVYPVLRQLETSGYITSYSVRFGERRLRQYYHMEKAGLQYYTQTLKDCQEMARAAKGLLASVGKSGLQNGPGL